MAVKKSFKMRSELVLRATLALATVVGCFPATYNSQLPDKFKFRWLHPAVTYSLALLVFNLLSSLNFIVNDLPAFVELRLGQSLAGNISGYIDAFNFLAGDALIRTFAILYCSRTVELIKVMRELRAELELLRRRYCWDYPQGNLLTGDAPGSPQRMRIYTSFLELRKYSAGRSYGLLLVAVVFHTINHTVKITSVVVSDDLIPIFHAFWRVPGEDWLFRSIWWLSNWLAIVSYIFGLSMVVVLGAELLGLYHGLKEAAVKGLLSICSGSTIRSSSSSSGGGGSSVTPSAVDQVRLSEQLLQDFKSLKDAFTIYSELAGTYVLIKVASACIAFGQFLFQFSVKQELVLFSHCFACVLWIYNMASIGDSMEVQIQEGSTKIKSAASLSKTVCSDQLRAVIKIIMDWNWRLTARNVFVVNRGLLLGCFQTVMTYMIFLFQLKLSEKSA